MMLKRKIEKEIMHWIESSDKALLIYGVRQAGKTFIIRECLKAGVTISSSISYGSRKSSRFWPVQQASMT